MHTNTPSRRGISIAQRDLHLRKQFGKQANLQISCYRAILGLESAAGELAAEWNLSRSSRSGFEEFGRFASEVKTQILELIQTSCDEKFSGMPSGWAGEMVRFSVRIRTFGGGERLADAIEAFAQGCFLLEDSLAPSTDDRIISHGLAAFESALISSVREVPELEKNREACA